MMLRRPFEQTHEFVDTSSTNMAEIIQMNDEGLNMLHEGYIDAAETMLFNCLHEARELMPLVGELHCIAEAVQSLESRPLGRALGPDDSWHGYQADHFVMCRFTFTFNSSNREWIEFGPSLPILFRAVVTYNLGLIYHHQGLLNSDVPLLSQAGDLYSWGIDLLRIYRGPAQGKETSLLDLALYNNLGHLYSILGDIEGMARCKEMLQYALTLPQPSQTTTAVFESSLSLSRDPSPRFASSA